jgi:hypothetical protein
MKTTRFTVSIHMIHNSYKMYLTALIPIEGNSYNSRRSLDTKLYHIDKLLEKIMMRTF